MEKGLNTELYWKNDDPTHTVSMVPTSAITGEGIPDLLLWLVRLTQVRGGVHEAGIEMKCTCFRRTRFSEAGKDVECLCVENAYMMPR